MKDLALIKETMSSVEIAELTGKEHKTVMRDIRNLIENLKKSNGYRYVPVGEIEHDYHRGDRTQPKYLSENTMDAIFNFCIGGDNNSEYVFKLSEYTDKKGEKRPQYELNKKSSLLLASGYDILLRAKIIDRWEELETGERELSRKDLALIVIQSEEEKERLQLQIEQNRATIEFQDREIKKAAPKVQYVDAVLQSVNTYTSTQVAKELGMREAEKLHKALKEKGIMFKQSGQWLLTSDYCGKDYTKPRTTTYTRSDGSQGTNTITVWTEKGRAFLHKLFGTIKAS